MLVGSGAEIAGIAVILSLGTWQHLVQSGNNLTRQAPLSGVTPKCLQPIPKAR